MKNERWGVGVGDGWTDKLTDAADDDSKSPSIGKHYHRYLKDLFLKDFFRKFSLNDDANKS